jgi:hypothetical protein
MSKSSIAMLLLFVALGIGWFLQDDGTAKTTYPAVVVEGFVSKDVSLQDVKILNKDDASPYTRWEVKRDGETYVLKRETGQKGRKHSEAKWTAQRTYAGGKTVSAKGETYRVRMYAQTLSRDFRSSYSFKATDKDLQEYGLDEKHRVEVKATGGDKTVHLYIGNVDAPSGENESSSKTWVMRPDVPDVIYQVAGFDLRKNIDVPWKDVRDRKLLDVNIARMDKVVLENPNDPLAKKVVAVRPKLPKEQQDKLAAIAKEDDKDKRDKLEKELRKSNDGWKIELPSNYLTGEVGGWLESTERMSLTEVVDTADGKAPANSGLGDPKEAVKITMFEGDKKTVVIMGKAMTDGEKDVWVKIGGNDAQVYRVASWSAEQVIKQLDDLRDLKLFGKDQAETVKAADNLLVDAPDGRFSARLDNGKWIARGVIADHKKVADFVGELAGLDVDYESGKARSAVGLDKPEWQVSLSAKGRTFRVALAPKKGEDYFGAVGAEGNTFKLQSWNADRVRKSASHLKDSHLVIGLSKQEITSIDLPAGDKERGVLSRDSSGKWQAKPATKLKAAAVDALAAALAEASWDTEIKGKKLKELGLDEPAHVVRFASAKGKFELRIAAKDKDGNPYIAVFKRKKPIVIGTMSSFSVTPLKKTLADLSE